VYGSTSGIVGVGSPISMSFTSSSTVLGFLPQSGPVGPLAGAALDPATTSSGAFGGDVLALRLNVDFSDAGATLGSSKLRFGNLTLCKFSALPLLNGMTVRQFLGAVNSLLGGGSAIYSISLLDPITQQLNFSFGSGYVSAFAQDHLVNGVCQ
jgi:hypothetical protein